MKESLIILLVVLVLLGLTAFRYRKFLLSAYYIWKQLNAVRSTAKTPANKEIPRAREEIGLVSCAKCGSWVSGDAAIRLNSRTHYCSVQCSKAAVEA